MLELGYLFCREALCICDLERATASSALAIDDRSVALGTAIINAVMYCVGNRLHSSPPQFAVQADFVYAKENHFEKATERNAVAERYVAQICPQVVWLMLVNSRA